MYLEDERGICVDKPQTVTKNEDEEPRERESSPMKTTDDESDSSRSSSLRPIPTLDEKNKFRKSLHSAASMVFHGKTGLPLTSSPAPLRRGQDRFDFDSSLVSPAQLHSVIKKSHYPLRWVSFHYYFFPFPWLCKLHSINSFSFLHSFNRSSETSQLLGSFEESVLRGRIEPVSTVEGFTAEIGASGAFCPAHLDTPVTVFFYTFCDNDKVSTPYLVRDNPTLALRLLRYPEFGVCTLSKIPMPSFCPGSHQCWSERVLGPRERNDPSDALQSPPHCDQNVCGDV